MVKRKKSWKNDPKKYVINEWGDKEMTISERKKRLGLSKKKKEK